MNFRSGKALRAASVAGLGLWAAWAGALGVGDPAPDFKLYGQRDAVQLAAQRGKLVYLDFWASWCGPCKQSFPWMNQLQSKYGAQGLQVIAVNVDTSIADARRFLDGMPANFTVAFDARGETPRRYEIKGMPTSMLISPEGKVLYVHNGFRADEQVLIEAQISQALAQGTRGNRP